MEYPELAPVLEAILKTVPAQKVILFGSRARGEARPESDYDLLVVVPPGYKTMRVWKELYLAASKAKRGFSLDLLLATPEDLPRSLGLARPGQEQPGLGPPWAGKPRGRLGGTLL